MSQVIQTSKEYFKSLQILPLALIAGQLLFGVMVYFMMNNGGIIEPNATINSVFSILIPVATILGILIGIKIYPYKLRKLKEKTTIKEKMTGYRSLLIKRFAFMEAPSFLAIIAVILTSNYYYFISTIIVTAIMVYLRPKKETVISDLDLNYNEIAIIENPDSIIAEFTTSDN